MKKVIFLILVAALLSTNMNSIYAQTNSNVDSTIVESDLFKELKIRNETLEEHNSQLIRMFEWSLGFAALFLVTVLGLIGFFTYRRFETDKENLINVLNSEIIGLKLELEKLISRNLEVYQLTIDDKLKDMTQDLETVAERVAKTITNPINSELSKFTSNFNAFKSSTTYDIKTLKINYRKAEAKVWEEKGVWSNAIRAWKDVAEESWSLNNKWILADSLDSINNLLSNNVDLDAVDATDINYFLNKLPPEFSTVISKIKEKL